MNPAMLQYLQQLYGQRGGTPTNWMPNQGQPTNWGPQQAPPIANDAGMYGPTLASLYGQAGMTGAPNMVNAPQGYGLGFNGPRPGGYMLGNQGPMPGGQTNWMPGNRGQGQMPQSPMPTRPAMTGQVNNGLAMQQRMANMGQANNSLAMQQRQANMGQQGRQQARQLRRLNRNSTGM